MLLFLRIIFIVRRIVTGTSCRARWQIQMVKRRAILCILKLLTAMEASARCRQLLSVRPYSVQLCIGKCETTLNKVNKNEFSMLQLNTVWLKRLLKHLGLNYVAYRPRISRYIVMSAVFGWLIMQIPHRSPTIIYPQDPLYVTFIRHESFRLKIDN